MKKWSKLVLAAMLSAGTLLLSGCIENLAPEGLDDLREAKVDLLKAQTALQTAQAAKVEAEAALLLSEAKINEAKAKQEEAKVKYEEAMALKAQYEAEYQALLNEAYAQEQADEHAKRVAELEALMAENAARLAEIEREAQVAAAELEAELLEIQARVARAQAAYDQALKDLAAAKVTLSSGQKEYLFPFETEVMMAEGKVKDYTKALEEAAEALEEALADVDEAKANKRAIYRAERGVVAAEAALEGAKEAVALAEEALKIDPTITDWAEKLEALVAEQEALRKEAMAGALGREEEAQVWRDSVAALTEVINQYQSATGYRFDDVTGEFSKAPYWYPETQTAPEIYVQSPKDEEGNDLFDGDFYWSEPSFVYGNADEYNVVSELDWQIRNYTSYADPSWHEAWISYYEIAIDYVQVSYEEQYAAYEAAVAAYKSGDLTAYYQEKYENEDWDPAARVAEFNEALQAYLKAVETYNIEMKKYDEVDKTEEYAKILETRKKAIDVALAARAKAYQTAYDAYNKASQVYNKASVAHDRAWEAYYAALNASAEVVRNLPEYSIWCYYWSVESSLTDAIAQYEADRKEEGYSDPEGKRAAAVAIYKTELKKVKAAQKAYDDTDITNEDDAVSVWVAAQEVWEAASTAWNNAQNEISAAYDAAYREAWNVYYDACEDLDNTGNPLEVHYANHNYLYEQINNAYAKLFGGSIYQNDSHVEYVSGARYNMQTVGYYEDRLVYVGEEGYYWAEIDLPEYAVNEETGAPKTVKVKDVVDMDYFLKNEVKAKADDLSATHRAYGWGYKESAESDWESDLYVVIGAPKDYPLSLPTVESYAAAVAEFDSVEAYLENYIDNFSKECTAAGGNAYLYDTESLYTPFKNQIDYLHEIENREEMIANTAVAAEHVAVLEAAKAEFEAYVAAFEAEVDALRPVVEEKWPVYMEQYQAMEEAMEVYEAKFQQINRTINYIAMLLNEYVGTTDVEGYVAYLEEVYEDAVEAVAYAEFDLEDAQKNLETVKNGGEDAITAVEMAQKAYDKVAQKLDKALAELAEAAAALQEAMVAVGAAEPEAE